MDCPVCTTILWVMAFVLVVNTILKGNTVRSAYQSTTGIWICQWRISMLALVRPQYYFGIQKVMSQLKLNISHIEKFGVPRRLIIKRTFASEII